MTYNNLENQKDFVIVLDDLEKQEQLIKARKRKIRAEYDEDIRIHGDLVLKEQKQKDVAAWRNRTITPLTEEEKTIYKTKHDNALLLGIDMGWWQFIENGEPIPFATSINHIMFHDKATMANVWHSMGLFESVSQARRSGKNQPITIGEHRAKGPNGLVRVIIL